MREVLHRPERDQDQRADHRERQQDADHAADQVDPEVAEPVGLRASEPADQRDGDGEPDCGGDEVLNGKAEHLDQVAHRRLTGVRLPVRVGHERGGRVERQALLDVGESERQRQVVLQAQQEVQGEHAHGGECEHRARVHRPTLVGVRVDSHRPVEDPLDTQGVARLRRRVPCSRRAGDSRRRAPGRSGRFEGDRQLSRTSEPFREQQRDHEVRREKDAADQPDGVAGVHSRSRPRSTSNEMTKKATMAATKMTSAMTGPWIEGIGQTSQAREILGFCAADGSLTGTAGPLTHP